MKQTERSKLALMFAAAWMVLTDAAPVTGQSCHFQAEDNGRGGATKRTCGVEASSEPAIGANSRRESYDETKRH